MLIPPTDVLEALRTIDYCCIAARGPCRIFRSVLCQPNLEDRGVIAMECLQQMERVILRPTSPSGAHVPRNGRPRPHTGLGRSLEPGRARASARARCAAKSLKKLELALDFKPDLSTGIYSSL
jgi:hypothetical protein